MGPLRMASGFTEFAGKSGVATSVIRRTHLQETEVWESSHWGKEWLQRGLQKHLWDILMAHTHAFHHSSPEFTSQSFSPICYGLHLKTLRDSGEIRSDLWVGVGMHQPLWCAGAHLSWEAGCNFLVFPCFILCNSFLPPVRQVDFNDIILDALTSSIPDMVGTW